jgi:hypothetical protein
VSGKLLAYLDFENVHAHAFDAAYAPHAYYGDCTGKHPVLLDLPALLRRLGDAFAPVGAVKAYANWWWFRDYLPDMNRCLVETVNVPHGCGLKNGADIALALDAITDAGADPAATHVVIGSHDSDFSGLALRLRRMGKVVIGLAVEGVRVNERLLGACDRFVYYPLAALKKRAAELPPPPPPRSDSQPADQRGAHRSVARPRTPPAPGANGFRPQPVLNRQK